MCGLFLTLDMPYKPDLRGETDLSSFETTFTKEAPIDSVTDGNDVSVKDGKSIVGTSGKGEYDSNHETLSHPVSPST